MSAAKGNVWWIFKFGEGVIALTCPGRLDYLRILHLDTMQSQESVSSAFETL